MLQNTVTQQTQTSRGHLSLKNNKTKTQSLLKHFKNVELHGTETDVVPVLAMFFFS